jgi:diguanylate cyclase (GGDEF)-like protein
MWESINNAGIWEGEIWNRRKNGEVYPEYLTITAVKDLTGIVNNYVGTFTDITLSNAASEEIKNLAFYDPLTQLPNRRLLTDRLQQALVASARNRQKGALLFLDLDHFKTLNDTLGHDIGDMLLQQVAERLTQCVRAGDTVARIGGDEFVILIEGLSERLFDAAAHTEAVADKILTSLNQVYQLGAHEYYSSPSIGATLFIGHEIALEELLKHADIAMYDAKKAGRNMLRFFDPVMQETINKRAKMDRDLRIAIAQKQFQLHYQVQVDIENQPLGAEALIRWIHPERGMVSPLNFIPLAEETGLILPIGQWVLETACAQLKAWEPDALTSHLTISINVSAKQFNQPDFVKQVQTTVQHYAINTSLLKLELTESMLLNNIEHVIITMVALETIGIQFSLDDFGTGYSSLQYLKMLPMNQLKIDQSFVRDITFDNNDKSIVSTVIAMANSLDMDVIAEGVETKEQRELLMSKGCEKYQGYLFGKPMPIEQFEVALLNT